MKQQSKGIRLGILGGGKTCEAFLEMIEAGRLPGFNAEVAVVSDENPDAPGIQLARLKGLPTTSSYRELQLHGPLDAVVDLTGNMELLEELRRDAPAQVFALESALSRLVLDMIQFRNEYIFEKRRLDMNEGILESIFSSIRDEVFVIDPDCRILDVNDAYLKNMGVDKESVVGKHCFSLTHRSEEPCEKSGELCPLRESKTTGSTSHAIHEHYRRDGSSIFHEVTTVPLKNEKGEVALFLEIMRDITDELEKRVEEKTLALKKNLARLIHEDKMIALGKLVSCAVHEINNPLSGILALARLMHRRLGEGGLSKEEEERFVYYLHLIDTEAARCGTLVSHLLSFSRQHNAVHQPFQLNSLIEKVVRLFEHKLRGHRVQLQLELAEGLPPLVGDPGQIQQCLVNLLFNAQEAMPEGGTITLRTHADVQAGALHLEVADTGPGIPEELMSQIFEPFFSTKGNDKGVGLGLSVVYGIIKDHQGSIYVKSQVGKGSNFSIRFPCLPSESEA